MGVNPQALEAEKEMRSGLEDSTRAEKDLPTSETNPHFLKVHP